jgi:hypothetical protein
MEASDGVAKVTRHIKFLEAELGRISGTPGSTLPVDKDLYRELVLAMLIDLDEMRVFLARHDEPLAETGCTGLHLVRRGSDVEAWIKRHRDCQAADSQAWHAVDWMLDDYRERADMGVTLKGHIDRH